VAASITPIRVTVGGKSFDAGGLVAPIAASALFANASFLSGTTQYGDAIQRAEFWQYTQPGAAHSAYHALLGAPTAKSKVAWTAPRSAGFVACQASAPSVCAAFLDINWWDGMVQPLASAIGATSLPIFVAHDVVLCDGRPTANLSNCGIGGYHSAVQTSTGIHTYAYGAWLDSNIFGTGSGFYNTAPLSHEIAEWYNDPFGTNLVPYWSVPSQPQYGCNNALEVGDPLVGVVFKKAPITGGTSQPLQDEAFLSWFAHQVPSIGYKGRYSYLGTFSSPATVCTP
jgi:hypothetical protein